MRQMTLGDYTIDVADFADSNINMTVRGVPDFDGLFLGQYTDASSNEFDLYYLPQEDTFLAYDIFPEQGVGNQYQLHSYSTLPIFIVCEPSRYLEEGRGLETGVAFRRWLSLQPKIEPRLPEVGMTFKWLWAERYKREEVVHITTSVDPAPSGWPEGKGMIWGVRRRSDGTYLSTICDNLTFSQNDFRFYQLVGRMVILDEVVPVPSMDDWDAYSAWRDNLNWAPGNSLQEEVGKLNELIDKPNSVE